MQSVKERLTQAEQAYHELQTGSQVVETEYNGRRMKFYPSSQRKLKAYIEELKLQINPKTSMRRGPARVGL